MPSFKRKSPHEYRQIKIKLYDNFPGGGFRVTQKKETSWFVRMSLKYFD
jgi:hypothetical protein